MQIDETQIINDRAALRAVMGEASARTLQKVIDHIDPICREFIAASPFLVMGTYGPDGLVDLSPKGDPAGFVEVLDDRTLAIPDRPGNRRLDTFENLLQNPAMTVIFMIPGHTDTLRVAGKGRLTVQPDILERMAINGRVPQIAVLLDVEEAFMHCAKCMVRSRMWQPDAWPDTAKVATLAEAVVAHGNLVEKGFVADTAEMEEIIATDRQNRLY